MQVRTSAGRKPLSTHSCTPRFEKKLHGIFAEMKNIKNAYKFTMMGLKKIKNKRRMCQI